MAFSEQELEEFKSEAIELLDTAEKSFLSLENPGADFRSAFDAAFRGFHNLKGAAGMMELFDLQAHTHELETILMNFKDKSSMGPDYISMFLRGIDAAKNILAGNKVDFDFSVNSNQPLAKSTAASPSPLAASTDFEKTSRDEFLSEAEEILERVQKNLRILETGSQTADQLAEIYRDV
ncbi:MAG: Hpt domain-containing protein, partial [Bdellovibrionales bacterium]|nr:Hpt domain-containing protein [Bdellovibrionales bacterium]